MPIVLIAIRIAPRDACRRLYENLDFVLQPWRSLVRDLQRAEPRTLALISAADGRCAISATRHVAEGRGETGAYSLRSKRIGRLDENHTQRHQRRQSRAAAKGCGRQTQTNREAIKTASQRPR